VAIELVTGHSGAAHVSGADAGAMHAGICGSDSYVLGAVPSVTMSDANTLVIQPCDLMIEGRHVRLSGTNTLSIRSGAQTGKRNDLVYVRYTYDASTGTESAKLGVKEGTTATTATDPALDNPSSVLDGATIADVAICRVSLDALTPTATWLLPQLPTLKALGDSVSQLAPVTLSPTFADTQAKKYFTGGFWRVGRIVIVDFFSSIGAPAAWKEKTLVTGLPSPSMQVWTPCVMQTSPDSARYMAYVDTNGSIKVANKSASSGGNWIAFSLTYVAAS
jgi:hypothetical protein